MTIPSQASVLKKKNAIKKVFQSMYSVTGDQPSVALKKNWVASKNGNEAMRKRIILQENPELTESLASAHDWIKEIEKEIKNDIRERKICIKSLRLYQKLFILYSKHVPEAREIIGDQIAQDKGGQITTEYLKALTEDGKNTPTEGDNYKGLTLLRHFCWNYSDVSLKFCAELGEMGAFPLLVADLKTFHREFDNKSIMESIILPCIWILHNCAKAPENKIHFREAAAEEVLVLYTKQDALGVIVIKMISLLTLAYVIDEKDSDIILSEHWIIESILWCLKNAIQSSDHVYGGFTALDIISGLLHLASNDSNKIIIVNEGILSMLVKLMETGGEFERVLCTKVVWVLSFKKENKTKIKEEPRMMTLLEKLQNKSGDAEENASGALWVLSDDKESILTKSSDKIWKDFNQGESDYSRMLPPETSWDKDCNQWVFDNKLKQEHMAEEGAAYYCPPCEDVSSVQKHIMISYQWDYQELIMQIKEGLNKLNYRVWIDVESMEGSMLEAMAKAVENSDVVLICTSQKYKDSPNCRTEAEYAYQRRKTVIPLLVQPKYQPDGWLGALQGTKHYFDFTNVENFASVFSKLAKELENKAKLSGMDFMVDRRPAENTSNEGCTATMTEKWAARDSVEHWSRDRVKNWASSNQIASSQIESLDGKSIAFLHNLKKTAPEYFYNHVSNDLGVSDTSNLTNLCRALDALDL